MKTIKIKQKVGKPLQFDNELVVEKAMNIFWKYGYNNTSIDLLENETGISRSSITNTYKNKKGLYLASIKAYQNFLLRYLIIPLRDETKTGSESLKAFFDNLLTLNNDTSCGGNGCMILNTANELSGKDEDIIDIMKNSIENLQIEFENVLNRGKNDLTLLNIPKDAVNILISLFISINTISKTLSNTKYSYDFTKSAISIIDSWE